ncbi:antibiotic biosynthesis monooxygenase family protein [Streptomyces sp. NPDC057939]|uniref:antibiotic biosynthesis monooxygenase family protein n=1 Tax=Streptomyces sp. NPDC057939 TaxID=3346284 RepID=UPI0036E1C37B
MPFINPKFGYFTAIEVFALEDRDSQERVLDTKRRSIDTAAHQGWVSSTLHSGVTKPGAADYTQWRSAEELEAHFAAAGHEGDQLWKGEVVSSQHHPLVDERIEVSPDRQDWTSIAILRVSPENQQALIDELTRPRDEWVDLLPGYVSHSVVRGLDGTFVVNYAQWESEETYWGFHDVPEEQWPLHVRESRDRARGLTLSAEYNTYRVVHARSAG